MGLKWQVMSLASRYSYCMLDSVHFGLRCVLSAINGSELFYSSNSPISSNNFVRPVVELSEKYTLQQISGTIEWEIVKK